MAINSWLSLQNINSWRFWTWKNKSITYLINNEPDIDKTNLYPNDPYEAKYQLLINKRESPGLKFLNDSKVFITYSNHMDNIKNTRQYNPNKKRKTLIVFHNVIADMLSNKKLNPIGTELFIRGKKLNISLAFI